MKRGLLTNKKGLSEVVTVGLVILLAIAAVVIVWSFVRPALTGIGEQISGECLTLSVKATSCIAATGFVNVHNGAGETTINEVRLVYYDTTTGNSEVESSTCTIAPLGTARCDPPVGEPSTLTPDEVDVAAVLADGRVCPEFGTPVNCA